MFRNTVVPPLLVCIMLLCALPASAHAVQKVVFDQGHGQLFLIERNGDLDLSRLAETFREAGYDVLSTSVPLSVELLSGADVLVLSGTFRPYTSMEMESIESFVKHGGRLCIMLHIGPPVSQLLNRLGVAHSNGVIREPDNMIDNDPANFRVTRLEDHPLFKGLSQFSLYGVWALKEIGPDMKAIAMTSPAAWIDLNGNGLLDPTDARQTFAVAVAGPFGKGKIVVFGDDAIFQNKYLTGNNLTLGENLAAWLTGAPTASARATNPRTPSHR